MPEQKEITAIILAGGKSSRMKQDKGLVYFNGKMLVEHVIDALKKITDIIIIITYNTEYKKLGYSCFVDELKNKGPLGGIYTGLLNSATQKNLLVGCDMPFLSEALLSSLINTCSDEDVLLTEHEGMAEPLCSVYDKNCMAHIRRLLEKNQLKITDAMAGLKTRVISFDNEDWFIGNEFANINTIEELNKYKS
jgi:molybdopterin-guanine dinucleotide biosynthesis protein A